MDSYICSWCRPDKHHSHTVLCNFSFAQSLGQRAWQPPGGTLACMMTQCVRKVHISTNIKYWNKTPVFTADSVNLSDEIWKARYHCLFVYKGLRSNVPLKPVCIIPQFFRQTVGQFHLLDLSFIWWALISEISSSSMRLRLLGRNPAKQLWPFVKTKSSNVRIFTRANWGK